jgi:hypothetical protein
MPSTRTLTYDASLTTAGVVTFAWFVAITLPTGVRRFTNFDWKGFPGVGALSYTANIDGASAGWNFAYLDSVTPPNTWGYGLMVGPIAQGDQGSSAVAWVSFIDLQGVIYNLANTVFGDGTVGLCGRPIDIWRAQFDPVALTLGGATLFFRGKVDSQQYGPTMAVLSLDPFRTRQREAPWLTASQLGAASLLPDVARTIQYYG